MTWIQIAIALTLISLAAIVGRAVYLIIFYVNELIEYLVRRRRLNIYRKEMSKKPFPDCEHARKCKQRSQLKTNKNEKVQISIPEKRS